GGQHRWDRAGFAVVQAAHAVEQVGDGGPAATGGEQVLGAGDRLVHHLHGGVGVPEGRQYARAHEFFGHCRAVWHVRGDGHGRQAATEGRGQVADQLRVAVNEVGRVLRAATRRGQERPL